QRRVAPDRARAGGDALAAHLTRDRLPVVERLEWAEAARAAAARDGRVLGLADAAFQRVGGHAGSRYFKRESVMFVRPPTPSPPWRRTSRRHPRCSGAPARATRHDVARAPRGR